jgi:OTU domain-containing protein 7
MSLYDIGMNGALSMYDAINQEGSSSGNSLEPTVGGAAKKLVRGISRATENADIVTLARVQLTLLSLHVPEFTFSLPDLSIYPG